MLRDLGGNVLEWEHQFREALLLVGRQLFGPLLQKRIDQIDAEFESKPEQQRIGRRSLEVATLFGGVDVERDYYFGPPGGHCPADAGLGLEGTAPLRPWLG